MPEENEPTNEPANNETKPSEFTAITSQEDFDKAIAGRLKRETAKYADYGDLKAKAEQFDAATEAQKSEAQKQIDAANKERDDALAAVSKSQREIALTRASIPEDEWDDFADWSPAQIAKYGEKAAAATTSTEKPKPPTQRGKETFVSGAGAREEVDETSPRKLAALIRGE